MPAKHQVNLLPKDTFDQSALGKFLKWAISIGRWVVVFTDLVVICSFLSRFYFDTKLADLHEEMMQKQAIIEATSEFEQTFRNLQKRLNLIKALTASKFEGEKRISLVTQILPQDITLTSLSLDQDKINLSGTALSSSGMANFLNSLISYPQIKNISISNLAIGSKGQTETIEFNLSTSWRKL